MKMWLKIFIVIAMTAVFFGSSFFAYVKYSQNLYVYNDDAVGFIPPFFHYQQNNNVAPSYADRYFLDVIYPKGYKILFMATSKYLSPIVFSKIIPYFTLLFFLIAVGAIAWRFGGAVAGFSAICLILSGQIFLEKMGGGLPRAFGFPILAAALLAGVYGRIYLLAVITIIGAMFYPVTGIISGVFLLSLLLAPSDYTGVVKQWNYKQRFILLVFVAVISAMFLLPQIMRGKEYGDRISAYNIKQFPEADIGGRYSNDESLTKTFFLYDLVDSIEGGLFGDGVPFVPNMSQRSNDMALSFLLAMIILIIVITVNFFIKSWKDRNYSGVAYSLFFFSFTLCYIASVILIPYLYFPQRYITYALPLFYVTIIPILLTVKNKLFGGRRKIQSAVAIVLVGLLIILFGGKINYKSGLTVNVIKYKALYDYIDTLSENTLIAGWPKKIYIEGLEYVTKRDILLSYELHQALHTDYLNIMRERTYAFIDAYFATDKEALIKLREKFGVDYLIVDLNDFKNSPPHYFEPFDSYIDEKWKNGRENDLPFILLSLNEQIVFVEDNIFVIDLNSVN